MALRPAPEACSSAAELDRWYWTRQELAALARTHGLRTTGPKAELAAALRDHLDGRPPRPPTPARRPAAPALPEPVTRATVLPVGQRCTQQLRRSCEAEVGSGFRFDAAVRAFVAAADGSTTVGELLDHRQRARTSPPTEIAPQFELNRFARRWHLEHPGETRQAALVAWRHHRDLPLEQRATPSRAERASVRR